MTKEELLEELKNHKITKEELVKIMVDNFMLPRGFTSVDTLDLSGLDFSEFHCNVDISQMKVDMTLYQNYQQVGGCLFQHRQTVGNKLWQNDQKAKFYYLQNTKDLVKENYYYVNKVK